MDGLSWAGPTRIRRVVISYRLNSSSSFPGVSCLADASWAGKRQMSWTVSMVLSLRLVELCFTTGLRAGRREPSATTSTPATIPELSVYAFI
jgi:hypothetical protein